MSVGLCLHVRVCVCVCMCAMYIHTYMHTCMHACIHTYLQIHVCGATLNPHAVFQCMDHASNGCNKMSASTQNESMSDAG